MITNLIVSHKIFITKEEDPICSQNWLARQGYDMSMGNAIV
jgi:hypothetical protein